MREDHFIGHLFNPANLRALELKCTCRTKWSHELLLWLHSDLCCTVIQEYHIKPNHSYKAMLSPRLWAGTSVLIKGIQDPFKRLSGLWVEVTVNCFAGVVKIFALSSWIKHVTYASRHIPLFSSCSTQPVIYGRTVACRGVGFNEIQGRTSGKPISSNSQLGPVW